jgi:hypothetical protein
MSISRLHIHFSSLVFKIDVVKYIKEGLSRKCGNHVVNPTFSYLAENSLRL